MSKKEIPDFTQNRELSWLRFNQRVLEEARDESVPLMERMKFVAIFTSNLDEFFMIRVGSLYDLAATDDKKIDLFIICCCQIVQTSYTDHKKLIQIAGKDCNKLHPLHQRYTFISRFFQHSLIKPKPR